MNGGSLPPPPKNTLSQEWEWSESRMGMETPLLINIYIYISLYVKKIEKIFVIHEIYNIS